MPCKTFIGLLCHVSWILLLWLHSAESAASFSSKTFLGTALFSNAEALTAYQHVFNYTTQLHPLLARNGLVSAGHPRMRKVNRATLVDQLTPPSLLTAPAPRWGVAGHPEGAQRPAAVCGAGGRVHQLRHGREQVTPAATPASGCRMRPAGTPAGVCRCLPLTAQRPLFASVTGARRTGSAWWRGT